ncbi:FCD domain-containing protein [bacterium]|nr:FCD domain-containing protein [bacterium]
MTSTPEPKRTLTQGDPPPAADNAARALGLIRQAIDAGAGDSAGRLPTEREWSLRLGVGRRAVRCALEVLEAEGLIWRQQGKGTFIGQAPDPTGVLAAGIVPKTDALSVMEARIGIEPVLAALAARRATPDDIARMRNLTRHIGITPDAETAELWDGALHRQIARIAANPILLTAFTLLDEVRMREDWQAMRQRARSPEALALYDRQHETLIDAIEAGDAEAARAAMTAHLEALEANLRRTLGDAAK